MFTHLPNYWASKRSDQQAESESPQFNLLMICQTYLLQRFFSKVLQDALANIIEGITKVAPRLIWKLMRRGFILPVVDVRICVF